MVLSSIVSEECLHRIELPLLAFCMNGARSDERKRPTDDGGKEGEKQRAPTESLIQQELKKQKVGQEDKLYSQKIDCCTVPGG